jgi:hypothetical protein
MLLMLAATFPAPPIQSVTESIETTGTGASGDILVTDPDQYRSSIMSPTTRIRCEAISVANDSFMLSAS